MQANFAAQVFPAAAAAMSRHLQVAPLHKACDVAWRLHLRGIPADLFYERLAARIEDEPVSQVSHASELALAMFACHEAGKLSTGRAAKMYQALS